MDNTAPLCYGCHSYIDGNPLIKVEFFMELLGVDRFNALDKRARTLYPKPDKEAIKEELKEKLKYMEDKDG